MTTRQLKRAQAVLQIEAKRNQDDQINLMVSKGYSIGAARMLIEAYQQSLTNPMDTMLYASAAPVRKALWDRLIGDSATK